MQYKRVCNYTYIYLDRLLQRSMQLDTLPLNISCRFRFCFLSSFDPSIFLSPSTLHAVEYAVVVFGTTVLPHRMHVILDNCGVTVVSVVHIMNAKTFVIIIRSNRNIYNLLLINFTEIFNLLFFFS